MRQKLLPSLSLLACATLGLTACGQGANETTSATDETISIVTTTDVYADLVTAVAGDRVEVTPIIASTAVDPHSYEATSQDRLTIKDADVVLVNGGGYDTFMTDMAGVDNTDQAVIDAVEISGLFSEEELAHIEEEHSHAHEGEDHAHHVHTYNEHVWYDLDTMIKVADELARELGALDPDHAAAYTEAAASFTAQAEELLTQVGSIEGQGRHYLATEPVSGYLLEDAGFTDATPEGLTAAVDSDSDIPPLTLQEAKDALTGDKIDLLAFNEQTQTAQTAEIFDFAQSASVPSVSFTETLPEGKGYLDWMADNISNLEKAVA